ncbi:MAG TPA: hypothetical protein VHW00_14735 [Thermoanaerobaculia bacterium]|nr:hypothetical protein [Thermoanaerobaculia bacterium]
MKSKTLLALSILCLALGACATTDSDSEDPNVARAVDHANQSSPAARADYVAYSTLTPNTEQTTVTTTKTEPVWTAEVTNPTDATVTQSASVDTTADTTMISGSTADNTASVSGSTTTTTTTTKTPSSTTSSLNNANSQSSSQSMTSASTTSDDDDDTTATTTATETRTRLRKD